jgi:hypothetical protein
MKVGANASRSKASLMIDLRKKDWTARDTHSLSPIRRDPWKNSCFLASPRRASRLLAGARLQI